MKNETVVIPGNCSTDSRWLSDCYCFGLSDMGVGVLMRFFLVFVVCFFVTSILCEVIR